jgi:hypothetical protein
VSCPNCAPPGMGAYQVRGCVRTEVNRPPVCRCGPGMGPYRCHITPRLIAAVSRSRGRGTLACHNRLSPRGAPGHVVPTIGEMPPSGGT